MKKSILFISSLLIGLSSFAQWQDFESWSQNTVQLLDDYETSVSDRGAEGALATYPSTDAVTGTYSVKLETVISPSNGDTIFGYFLSGDPDNFLPGQAVIGLPPMGAIDSIVGWYKYDVMPGDSAALLLGTFLSGNPTGGGTYYVTGQQLTWKRFAYEVGAPASDSILLAAATGDPLNNFNGIAGTWMQFDDIQLIGGANTSNVLNYSFENWSPFILEDLTGWATSNQWAWGEPTLPVVKTTDSYAGTYAAQLTIMNSTTSPGDTLWGAMTNGYWGNNGPMGGEPFSGNPATVECYYKYAPSGGDQASINFEFKFGGTTVAQHGGFLSTQANYTQFSQPCGIFTADSVLITVWAGNNIGSQLKIDNIDILFPVGVAEGLKVERVVTYPNPATDELKIRFNIDNDSEVNVRLIDATGKEISSRYLGHLSNGTYNETFNTSNFSSGVYFIEFNLGKDKIVERFVVK